MKKVKNIFDSDKKQRIIDAALILFRNSHDVKKVSIEAIAGQARVSPTTIYNYFGTREAMVQEIIQVIVRQNLERNKSIVYGDVSFPQKLMGIIGGKMDIVRQMNGEIIEKFISQDPVFAPLVDRIYETEIKPLWNKIIADGKEQGYIERKLDENALLIYLDVLKAGFSAKPQLLRGFQDNYEMIQQLTNLMFYGFLKKEIDLFGKGVK